MKITKVDHEL